MSDFIIYLILTNLLANSATSLPETPLIIFLYPNE